MATLRLFFRVSKIQQYSDNFFRDLLRAGLSSVLHGKPLEVPGFGQISAIVLLGNYHLDDDDEQVREMGISELNVLSTTGANGKSFYVIGDEMTGELLHFFVFLGFKISEFLKYSVLIYAEDFFI